MASEKLLLAAFAACQCLTPYLDLDFSNRSSIRACKFLASSLQTRSFIRPQKASGRCSKANQTLIFVRIRNREEVSAYLSISLYQALTSGSIRLFASGSKSSYQFRKSLSEALEEIHISKLECRLEHHKLHVGADVCFVQGNKGGPGFASQPPSGLDFRSHCLTHRSMEIVIVKFVGYNLSVTAR